MDPPFSGFVLDPSKCRKLSIEEKRELIRELAKWPESAPEKLQTWSRRDLLEILCAEIGKERKYTGLTKQKMIEYLFRIVSEKKSEEQVENLDSNPHPPPQSNSETPSKRQRKNDHPSRLPVAANNLLASDGNETLNSIRYCPNLACRATLNLENAFCKRCSCCICHKYDDNKDPSLWLFCSSEAAFPGNSCGLSCHLECALKDERAGIVTNGLCSRLDGSYCCIYCGKVNDLLGCWKKQLIIAKDARRVDVLCYRISLSHKLLSLTEKYKSLHEIVDTAVNKLKSEVGPINGLPNMARGIVNRLSVGAEVQRLCARAIESLDSMLSDALPADPQVQRASSILSSFIKFEGVSSTSLTVLLDLEDKTTVPQDIVGCNLWHRKANTADYPVQPTCTLIKSKRRFDLVDITPSTEYMFKIVAFSNLIELGSWEVGVTTEGISEDESKGLVADGASSKPFCRSPKANSSGLSNPSSEGDESNNNTTAFADLNKSPESCFGCSEKSQILDTDKIFDNTCKETSELQHALMGTISGTEGTEQEETPGHSASALDEEPNSTIQTESHRDSTNSTENNQAFDVPKSENESNTPSGNEMMIVPFRHSDSVLPNPPCRLEAGNEGSGKGSKVKPCGSLLENGPPKPVKEPGSSSKKRSVGKCEEMCNKDGSLEGAYEYCVKVVRWLECDGHIETNFRVKFLTWFSLRATPQERRIVSVYVDTLVDDPASLAGQLVDTFSEAISSKRPPLVPTGFCTRLWH